ncbi:hypothetical protein JaAD80_15470 [Janthinobacterium sp. AD80]|nr:hypothetical protein JaAD80_15470 [Janthinobacterium sp. AD80]
MALLFTAISFSRSLTFFSSSLTRAAASSTCFTLAILSSSLATALLPGALAAGSAFDSFSLSCDSLTAVGFSCTLVAPILPAVLCVACAALAGLLWATWPASLLR